MIIAGFDQRDIYENFVRIYIVSCHCLFHEVIKLAKIPKRIRDNLLIEYDFSCCACGQKYFCDIHHITPRHKGGTEDPSNLVVLCPSCHRYADRGAYSTSQLRKLMKEHLERVKQAVIRKTQLARIQQMQIADFIYRHCIKRHYPREKYVKLEPDHIYFIAFDLVKIGLIVDPTDMNPILVSEDESIELLSLEVISNPFRLMFWEEWQRTEKTLFGQHFLTRVDVASAVGKLPDRSLAEKSGKSEDVAILRKFRRDIHRLITQEPGNGG